MDEKKRVALYWVNIHQQLAANVRRGKGIPVETLNHAALKAGEALASHLTPEVSAPVSENKRVLEALSAFGIVPDFGTVDNVPEGTV